MIYDICDDGRGDDDDSDFQKGTKDTNKVQKVPNIIKMHLMMGVVTMMMLI